MSSKLKQPAARPLGPILCTTLALVAGCGPKAIDPEQDLLTFEKLIHRILNEHLAPESFEVSYELIDALRVDRWQVDYAIEATINVVAPTVLSNCPSPDQLANEIKPAETIPRFLMCPALRDTLGQDGTIAAGTEITLPDDWRLTKELRSNGYAQSLRLRWIGSTDGVTIVRRDSGMIIERQVVIVDGDEAQTETTE